MAKGYAGDNPTQTTTPANPQPATTTAAPAPPPSVIAIITKVAKSLGVPPELALAIAYHESGLNPYRVGDNGTSFGLFQLHEGGELGNHSAAWAYDVYHNALTALTVVKQQMNKNPGGDWGQIAAAAQRPKDPAAYAASVSSILTNSGSNIGWFAQQNHAAAQSFTPETQRTFRSTAGSGTAAGTGGDPSLTAQLTPQELNAGLSKDGFAIGLIDSNAELKDIVTSALKNNSSVDETVLALQNSKWFRTHSQAQQQYLEMKYSSPDQLKRKVAQTAHDLTQMSQQLGVPIADINALANSVVYNGMDQVEQTAALVKGFHYSGQGLSGQAGADVDSLKQFASQYDVGMSNNQYQSMIGRMLTGQLSPNDMQDFFKTQALSKYPHLKKQLDAGLTIADVASPYKQEMAKLWNDSQDTAANIATSDPTIQKALQQSTPDGTQLMPIWQFQQTLKQDPRWLKTNNARDSLMDTTTSLLQSMGLMAGGAGMGGRA